MRGRFRHHGFRRRLTGLLAAGALLLLALAPMPLEHRTVEPFAAIQGHASHHAATPDAPVHSPEHALHPHCPLCTLAKVFTLPGRITLPVPVRREATVAPFRMVAVLSRQAAARMRQQPRAPPLSI